MQSDFVRTIPLYDLVSVMEPLKTGGPRGAIEQRLIPPLSVCKDYILSLPLAHYEVLQSPPQSHHEVVSACFTTVRAHPAHPLRNPK